MYYISGTSYRTRWWLRSYQYTTTITHADDSKELVTRWTNIEDSSAESTVIGSSKPAYEWSSMNNYGSPRFPLVTLAYAWEAPGYRVAQAVMAPGKATQIRTEGTTFASSYEYNGNTYMLDVRDLEVLKRVGEASIKGAND